MIPTIFDLCVPREEVLRGELREDTFAARLKDVLDGNADPVYGDAAVFFENTYPTAGLRTLLTDALGRLVGSATGRNSLIRLETAFGGGKTHNLIALYHAASGKTPTAYLERILGQGFTAPLPAQIRTAGVVGVDLDPTGGVHHPEHGIRTYTLWGELAYQLGGPQGYARVRESDENRAAAGTGIFDDLVGERPTLIMLDEIARHLRAASAVPTRTGKSNLAEQTVAFLMSLLETAASKERCLVVLTLASDADAFHQETNFLTEALKITARAERVLTPTAENEIPAIVTHRLFRHIDRQKAQEVFQAYGRYYASQYERNTDLPQRCLRAEYLKEFADSYPFHPELLATLNRKTATIPNFNQTRGALRLLAWTVRRLWQTRPERTWTIHLHHIDLADPQIVEDLTSRLDRPKFKQVIEADIHSPTLGLPAHAQNIDEPLLAARKPPYAQRIASTILIHSLTLGKASGVDPADLWLNVLAPDGGETGDGDDPGALQHALERLYRSGWFLEYDGHYYRFKTDPSLNKIIEDETSQIGPSKAKNEIERRIRLIWKRGFLQPVYFPSQPADLDDDAGLPKLAILHFDALRLEPGAPAAPELIRRLYEYTGQMETYRKYQNNVLFLVTDAGQAENMVQVTRRHLAIGRIVGDADRLSEFSKEQKEDLKKALDASELDVRVAITKAYRYLYYPSADAGKQSSFLARETLPAQDQGETNTDQTNVIIRLLRALKKVQTADDEIMSAVYVKARGWDQDQASLSTEDLRKAFARKIQLRILLDPGQLRRTIHNGVQTKTWVYYDSREQFAYDADSPVPAFQISEDTYLYLPEKAERAGLHIKGKWSPQEESPGQAVELCPVCGLPVDQCICGLNSASARPARLSGEGPVNQAFQQVLDQGQELSVQRIARLVISISGTGRQVAKDLHTVGLAIPQFGLGAHTLRLELVASFSAGESIRLDFNGRWDRYKRLKPVSDAFASEASELRASLLVTSKFEGGLEVSSPEFLALRDILATLDVSHLRLEALPWQEDPA